jgi:hypothetical protein
VARNTIPYISRSVIQADNQLHSIIQGYMTYIEENNSIAPKNNDGQQSIFTHTQQNHT